MATSTNQPNALGIPWLNTIVIVNFFVFSFLVRYSALGISPAKQGFVIRERVQLIAVTESVWLLNLLYTYLSWLSPLCMVLYAIVWQNDRLGQFSLRRSIQCRSDNETPMPHTVRLFFYAIAAATIFLGFSSLTGKLIASLASWYSM